MLKLYAVSLFKGKPIAEINNAIGRSSHYNHHRHKCALLFYYTHESYDKSSPWYTVLNGYFSPGVFIRIF